MNLPAHENNQPGSQFDIGIVGAGMVGSALACGLARVGYRVVVFDRQLPPPFDPLSTPGIRVSALSLASEKMLADYGAWQYIESMRRCPYRRLAVWEKQPPDLPFLKQGRRQGTLFDCKEINEPELGAIVENNVTWLALHQAMASLPTITLMCPAILEGLAFSPDKVTISIKEQPPVEVKLVTGADGALSKVREWADIGLTSNQYDQQAMVITVEYNGHQEDITWQEFTPTGPLAFLPLPDVAGRHYGSLVWYNTADNINRLMKLGEQQLIDEIGRNYPGTLPAVTHIVDKGCFPLIKRHAQTYHNKRAVLVGDAAHTINPLAGQGVNLGFQDVVALVQILSRKGVPLTDPGDKSSLENYESERRPLNSQMMLAMDLFYHAFSNTHAPLRLLRNLGLNLADKLPFAKQQVLQYATGIKQPPKLLFR
ncbi:MAG: hypothetical protein CSA52_02075 [Gammaproteobacteria bacterium]|nr:MAG: hypothetical protein CSB48_01550 [Pseudomonadota bacterium]PIE38500.1 MAG: hypothetical protein CSA52_02075 [Gammaproteobacteria bacterium]